MLSPEHILQTGLAFRASKVLLSAVELGVFTELGKGPRTVAQLRRALGLNGHAPDLLDTLVALGFLLREGQDARAIYLNTRESGYFLDQNSPAYLGALLEKVGDRTWPAWSGLTSVLRAGPKATKRTQKTGADAATVASIVLLAEQFDFSRFRTVADVGSPRGLVAQQIGTRYPQVSGTALALPRGSALRRLRLPEADAVVLFRALRALDARAKRALLSRVFDALPAGGCLVAVENLNDGERRLETSALLAALSASVERTAPADVRMADFDAWARSAGFARTEALALIGPVGAAIAYKEGPAIR